MFSFKDQNSSTAEKENELILQLKDLSPVNFNITPKFKTLSFLDNNNTEIHNYGMILLGQTHGYYFKDEHCGAFQVEDRDYAAGDKRLDYEITLFTKNDWVQKSSLPENKDIVYKVFPLAMNHLNIEEKTLFYSCYCYSYKMIEDYKMIKKEKLSQTTYFGYNENERYSIGSDYLVDFFGYMSYGMTYENAIDLIIKDYHKRNLYGDPKTNKPTSKQRYFSISTDDVTEFSVTSPIIKAQINGYSNLKSKILYFVYAYRKGEKFDYTDIITKGKLINSAANDGKGINDDGTFSFIYPDIPITQYPEEYNVVVGFNYGR